MASVGDGGYDETIPKIVPNENQRLEELKCQAGDETYCSYAENHPAETAAFVIGGVATAGVAAAVIAPATVSLGTATTVATSAEAANVACGGDMCADEINTGINTVYQVVQNGKTIYVGITQNFGQRAAYWLTTNKWVIEPIPGLRETLSRTDARAVEQVLIETYTLVNLVNKINSIAATNPIYQSAIQRGSEILQITGFLRH
jgi:hypothetical protein